METVNQGINGAEQDQEQEQERIFTQDELEKVIATRLRREREKYADYEDLKSKAAKYDQLEEANKSELQKATERSEALQRELDTLKKAQQIRDIRDTVAKEMEIPASLLTADTDEGCREQAQALLAFKNQGQTPPAYPSVKDGGEVQKFKPKSDSPRDKFAAWAAENF